MKTTEIISELLNKAKRYKDAAKLLGWEGVRDCDEKEQSDLTEIARLENELKKYKGFAADRLEAVKDILKSNNEKQSIIKQQEQTLAQRDLEVTNMHKAAVEAEKRTQKAFKECERLRKAVCILKSDKEALVIVMAKRPDKTILESRRYKVKSLNNNGVILEVIK